MKIADKDARAWLSAAAAAAREAGRLLSRSRRVSVEKSVGRDVKLDMDRRSEALILRALKKRFDFPVLAEESGRNGSGPAEGPLWIVDPLDGSMNYLRGLPLCCVSIGLWQDGKPVLGAICDFNRDELFTGIAGRGAWLNGKPIRASLVAQEDQATLATGFPVSMDHSSDSVSRFVDQVRRYRKIRMLGSAALSAAYVAAGRADVYYENSVKLWDVAAGLAIVLGAGGAVRTIPSKTPDALTVFAAGAKLPVPDFVKAAR